MSIPKIVKNIRSDSAPPFLQIPYSDWIAAGKTLTKSAFILYLYIAQNANDYMVNINPTDLAYLQIMPKSSAFRAIEELQKFGYIEDGIFYVQSKEKRIKKEEINKEIKSSL